MGQAKIIRLDEYRRARQYRNLLQMIEGHLAEAGLLATDPCSGRRSCRVAEARRQSGNAEDGPGEHDL